jgi:hypothetical protein
LTRNQRPEQAAEELDDDDDEEDQQEAVQAETKAAVSKQRQAEASTARRIAEVAAHLTTVLPAGKVFPIQIGSDLFRLSGASLSSDGMLSVTIFS